MKKLSLAILAVAIHLFAAAQTGQAWQQKLSPGLLENARNNNVVPFLIELTGQADVSGASKLRSKEEKGAFVFQTLKAFADKSQAGLRSVLDAHGVSYEAVYIVNAIKTEGDLNLIREIAQRSDVIRIFDNTPRRFAEPVETKLDPGGSRSAIEWGIERIQADDVWAMGYRGQNVVVGGEDTGYDWSHPALRNQYRGYDAVRDTADHNYNWHDAIHVINGNNPDSINPCGLDSKVPCDDYGHGTHTMGTMVGLDGDNQIGVAPDAKWCGCRNMERGWGAPFTYIECFEWFLAPTDLNNENPDPAKAPHVINNSWGCPESEGCDSSNFEIMNMVVNNLRQAGIVVVVSAGNSGSGCGSVNTPAPIFEGSFSVGATAPNDTIAGFSSRGPVSVDGSNRLKPNVSAPGVWVRSSVPGGAYEFSSGTSMAGPHVVGLVALIISANPELAGQVDLIEDIIEQTAVPKTTDQNCGEIPGSEVPNNTYGFGRIDALAAVEAALALIEPSATKDQQVHLANVYPNPVTEELIIALADDTTLSIELYNTQGERLLSRNLGGAQGLFRLDMSSLAPGLYFYTLRSGNKIQPGKVMKVED